MTHKITWSKMKLNPESTKVFLPTLHSLLLPRSEMERCYPSFPAMTRGGIWQHRKTLANRETVAQGRICWFCNSAACCAVSNLRYKKARPFSAPQALWKSTTQGPVNVLLTASSPEGYPLNHEFPWPSSSKSILSLGAQYQPYGTCI